MVNLTWNRRLFFGLTADLLKSSVPVVIAEPFEGSTATFFSKTWARVDYTQLLANVLDHSLVERVIDIGAGDGRFVSELAAHDVHAVGIEISGGMSRLAQLRLSKLPKEIRSRCRVVQADFRNLPHVESNIDVVTSVGLTVATFDDETRRDFYRLANSVLPIGGRLIFDILDVEHQDNADFFTEFHRTTSKGGIELVLLDCVHRPADGYQLTNLVFQTLEGGSTNTVACSLRCKIQAQEELSTELEHFGFGKLNTRSSLQIGEEIEGGGTDIPSWGVTTVIAEKESNLRD